MTNRISIVPYLSSWNPDVRRLAVDVLLMPDGDPRPAFASATFELAPRLYLDPDVLPAQGDAPVAMPAIPLAAPADRAAVVDAVARMLNPPATPDLADAVPRPTSTKKHLPPSYQQAFSFISPRVSGASIGDEYAHVLRCGTPIAVSDRYKPAVRSWGDALAWITRQPAVLRAAGMLYTVELALPAGLPRGGWIGFELSASPFSDVRVFLSRIPALATDATRPLFTAVLFPFVPAGTSLPLDGAFDEAARFDDGFAKIVHARQPETQEAHFGDDATSNPGTERGVSIAWDDEDVLAGMNRNLAAVARTVPRGVAGYRIDAREGITGAWRSLCAATADELRVDAISIGGFAGELRVEVHPRSVAVGESWLPPYYTSWLGGSAVLREPIDRYLHMQLATREDPNAVYRAAPSLQLRYGRTYQLRVRLANIAGGGPTVDAEPHHAGEAPVATLALRRWVALGALRVSNGDRDGITVQRPLLGFPSIAFASDSDVRPQLADLRDAGREIALPDPDAASVEAIVWVRGPAFDLDAATGGWRELYRTRRSLPSGDAPLRLAFTGIDVADLASFPTPVGDGPIAVPTARDLRIELRAIGEATDYFAGGAERGSARLHELHLPATEPALFRDLDPAAELRAVFLRAQPDTLASTNQVIPAQSHATVEVVERLAAALGLRVDGSTVFGGEGRRVVFGCAGAAHRLAPDHTSLSLLAYSELVGSWACAVRIDLDRDWSWLGLAPGGVSVSRTRALRGASQPAETVDVGALELLHAVNRAATEGEPDRTHTSLVFVDVFAPVLDGTLPCELDVTYTLTATMEAEATPRTFARTASIRLPAVTPPAQVPRVVSVGHAVSPFVRDDAYTSTRGRSRSLWLELDAPIADPHDALFARVLAHAPDPMLLAGAEAAADPPLLGDLPVDAELARLVVPGQADDRAGASALQRLIPASSDPTNVHFLLPLPPGKHEGSPDLLGFYTYELRIGHDPARRPLWCTARGRFGAPLVLDGVQHPAPELPCRGMFAGGDLVASADFAEAYYDGRTVQPDPPMTELWIAIYAQVAQADGSGPRNVEIDVRRADAISGTRRGEVRWSATMLASALGALGLPVRASLSVLAIELLPEHVLRFRDPLRANLGEVRVLRSSPLVAVPPPAC